MTLLDELEQRGALDDVTDRAALDQLLSRPGQSIYIGFDPTADSLHVGSLVPALMLSRFQRAGHRPIVLVGGSTGMIGDPSGRSAERPLMTPEMVRSNVEAIRRQLTRFVSFEGENAAIVVNNYDWTSPVSYLDFLRDVGKHFTVNYMLAKESVRRRLEDREHGISYAEFSYMLLQAFDFLVLHDTQNCKIQGGGSDQWGNITAGAELIRKVRGGEAFGVTFPLLTTASGEKFGKSAGNAVWLDANKTRPYQFYQYWINTDDRDAARFLKLFTFLSLEEIERLQTHPPEQRIPQKRLAFEVTALVHGREAAEQAEKSSLEVFAGGEFHIADAVRVQMAGHVPSFTITAASLEEGVRITDVVVMSTATSSKSEAARLIKGGGVYLNEKRVDRVDAKLRRADLGSETTFVLRVGKKSYYLGRVNT